MSELLRPDDTRDALRKLGGLLLGMGALMLLLRKSVIPQADPYKDGVKLIIWAIPAALLYGGSLTQRETGGLRPWQAVYSVFGLIFVAGALLQLVDTIDETPDQSLTTAGVFAVIAALAFYAGAVRGIRFQFLFGGIALIIAWSALWDRILSDGIGAHFGVYRGLLGILSIGLLCGALYLWRSNPGGEDSAETATRPAGDQGLWKASELFTAAGISAVLACSLGISALPTLNPLSTTEVTPVDTSWFWDVLLLVVSLGLVGIGSRIGLRGPVYVGAAGLFLFLLIVGFDLDSERPQPSELGTWPIVLLVLGAIAIVLSGVKEASLGDRPRRLVEELRRGRSGGSSQPYESEDR
ncbi:MAG: hypothetical protein ACRDL6_03195 [Solirubrobacterales bacterium]